MKNQRILWPIKPFTRAHNHRRGYSRAKEKIKVQAESSMDQD